MRFPETAKLTPNVSNGVNERHGVVLHHTAGGFEGAVAWLRDPRSSASAHVVIAKDGRRVVLAADDAITWHAGTSAWNGRSRCNEFMLGVEFELTAIDVETNQSLTPAQIESCLEWLAPRMAAYGWDVDQDITDHRTVALPRGRKRDLSPENYSRVMTAIRARFKPSILAPQPQPLEHVVTVPKGTRKIVILLEG